MGIEYFLQQLVNGICLGGMYALMSVGYSLVYSIMNFSNFAHGGVIMVGAYVGYFALTALNVPFLPAFLLCGVGSGLLAVIIERLVYSPLRKRHAPSLYFIISAMGASIFLENFVIATIDGTPRNYPPIFDNRINIGENIGDLGGVNIALKAYAFALGKAAGKSDAKEDGSPAAIKALLDTAPEMDGFTGLQRFFLSYASIWRTKNRDELAEQYLQIDPHSPAEFRTNGIASNVDLFYDAFGVTEGDAMWLAPKDRVSIW